MQMIFWYNLEVALRNWGVDVINNIIENNNDTGYKLVMIPVVVALLIPYLIVVWPLKLIEQVFYFLRHTIFGKVPVFAKLVTLPLDLIYLFFHLGLAFALAKLTGII